MALSKYHVRGPQVLSLGDPMQIVADVEQPEAVEETTLKDALDQIDVWIERYKNVSPIVTL